MTMTLANPNEMRRRASSKALILAALREAGSRGVTNVELNAIAYRYGGRIFELKAEGHDIPEPTREGGGVFRYVLRTGPRPGQPGYLAAQPVVGRMTGRAIPAPAIPDSDTPAATGGRLFDL